jgi:cytoskeletal protein RodZ
MNTNSLRITYKKQVFLRRMHRLPPSGASFGEELKRERLLRNVSLEEISAATKISIRLLTALEAGDVSKLPAPVFIRGFIRAYSLHLGLDPIQKTNAYLGDVESSTASPAAPTASKPQGGSRFLRGPRSTAGTIVGGVTAVLLLLGLIANPEHHRPTVARRSRPALVEPVSFKNVAPSNEPTPLIRQESPESTETSVPEEGVALVLEFDDSSWVEISADGSKVFGGLVSAGESRRFAAQHEFRVTLGNAGGVRVSIDGQPSARLGRPGEVVRDVRLPDPPSRG